MLRSGATIERCAIPFAPNTQIQVCNELFDIRIDRRLSFHSADRNQPVLDGRIGSDLAILCKALQQSIGILHKTSELWLIGR